ncbi:EboA domain-containing protein [Saccharopolyspora sp. 6M]|uniref:EboA domain-containing protein n=1 Tax=Saccharopolyspora sp. 6M TaxID=2877237 RepID=UPI001CD78415|nr:EboA domain-containing protein [Saccharopolyspora sp. 6M]MCA1225025.1 EboA domain-containing protein [Saccharopolyspora sp. 6M]
MSGFALGYGTNGFSNHRLDDALTLIAELGYTAVALTLDHDHLDPWAPTLSGDVARVASRLRELDLRCVVETGARYLLDPRRKHHPTLLCAEPEPRAEFLRRAVRIGAELGADSVSFWSGVREAHVAPELARERLLAGIAEVLDEAGRNEVPLGLEPEPGMFVQQLSEALDVREALGSPEYLGITLDVGHCVAVEPVDAATCVRQAAGSLVNVQLDDMLPGVHEHLEFGDGDLDLPGTLAALDEVGYRGVAAVELPRHSHAAPAVARRAITALRRARGEPATSRWELSGAGAWVEQARARIRADPTAIRALFPAAGRHAGRAPIRADVDAAGLVHGTEDDRARTAMLTTLAAVVSTEVLAAELGELYRYGDGAERRGVLRALHVIPAEVAGAGIALVEDALRTNDSTLIAASMGSFAARHLDQPAWRHGVLKCLFLGIPLAAVAELERRRDDELARMVTDFARERRAAGRPVPRDADRLLAARN